MMWQQHCIHYCTSKCLYFAYCVMFHILQYLNTILAVCSTVFHKQYLSIPFQTQPGTENPSSPIRKQVYWCLTNRMMRRIESVSWIQQAGAGFHHCICYFWPQTPANTEKYYIRCVLEQKHAISSHLKQNSQIYLVYKSLKSLSWI